MEEETKVIDFKERSKKLREDRRESVNSLVIDASNALDPDDPKFFLKAKAITELEKQLIAEDANQEIEKHNRWTRIFEPIKTVLQIGVGVAGVISNRRILNKITRFETDGPGAFLTQSDRQLVSDTLKEGKGIFRNFPKIF